MAFDSDYLGVNFRVLQVANFPPESYNSYACDLI